MDYRPLLKRAGAVLVVVGLLDVALMIVAIMSGVSYSSSLNFLAVIAGVFLLRGSLRAASLVRQFSFFILGASVSFMVLSPFVLPLGLLLTQIQVDPLAFAGSLAFFVVALFMFAWLIGILGSPEILQARQAAGLPLRRPHIPLAIGASLAVLLAVSNFFIQRSDSASRAIAEARAALGDEYSFHVTSINFHANSQGKSVGGIVTAWKSGSIKEHRFSWRE